MKYTAFPFGQGRDFPGTLRRRLSGALAGPGLRVLAALALCGLLALPALAGNQTQSAAQPAPRALFAHFLALPEAFPDGVSAAPEIERFRRSLVELCGGYTELGPAAGAWLDPSGRVQAEGNRAFLVTCPDNRGAELSRAIRERFRQQEAYVLVWAVESP